MLAFDLKDIIKNDSIVIKNRKNGVFSFSKSYSIDQDAEIVLFLDRTSGLYGPELLIHADGSENITEFNFAYDSSEGMYDVYILRFPISEICKKTDLLFYKIRFSAGCKAFYYTSTNNVDGILTDSEKGTDGLCEFKMLVHESDYTAPSWYHSGIMYHIFVDRFFKGSRSVPLRDGAIMNEDWYNGIPQYVNIPGQPLANNMFFGGTLFGIAEKLDYLSSLGISVIYLSPISKAYSNHKYDTGDYSVVDEMFGGQEALDFLVAECKKKNIRIILDGVFNHTGDDSKYFNKYGTYGDAGAYRNRNSEYCSWYRFSEYPEKYDSWWGITILPKLDTTNPEVAEYLAGEAGIVSKYLDDGVYGYRLDVADELPDSFLEKLRNTVKKKTPEAVIIGEVWENAADKCAYGSRRSYFRGKQLDGVMNYPLKNGIVSFMETGNVKELYDTVCDIYSSYPLQSSLSLMNILGTHDTERILTVLGTHRHDGMNGDQLAHFSMTPEEYDNAVEKLRIASVLQYTLPGVPSVFYGDEAGVQGARDPFCRKTFPWGKEDVNLVSHYKKLGKIRRNEKALAYGELSIDIAEDGVFSFRRIYDRETVTVTVNLSARDFKLALETDAEDMFDGTILMAGESATVVPYGFMIIKQKRS